MTTMRVCRSSVGSLLCLFGLLATIHGWTFSNMDRRKLLLLTPPAILTSLSTETAMAADDETQSPSFRSSLKAPTPDQPQIPLPTAESLQSNQNQVVEGLLYLKNPRSPVRPTASDVILVTVRDIQDPDIVLAGAKLPMSRIQLPVRFTLKDQNVLSTKQSAWQQAVISNDLIVQAKVCNRDDIQQYDCRPAKLSSKGIAKLLKLNQGTIRAAVSLPLE